MPQPGRKRVLNIQFKPFDSEIKDSQGYGSLLLKGKGVKSVRSCIPSFGNARERSKRSSSLPLQTLGSKLGRTRIVGGIPSRSRVNVSSGKLPLKSQNILASKLPTRAASLLNKKVSSSFVTEALLQKEHAAPRFLSLLMGKGRLIRHKATQLSERKVWWNAEEAKLFSHAHRLQLFQVLLKEPLPFLELHGRFGISKQTIKRLVKNGVLTEVWGPKNVGVRFRLTGKGKILLKELEAATRYEPKKRESVLIRLKNRTFP